MWITWKKSQVREREQWVWNPTTLSFSGYSDRCSCVSQYLMSLQNSILYQIWWPAWTAPPQRSLPKLTSTPSPCLHAMIQEELKRTHFLNNKNYIELQILCCSYLGSLGCIYGSQLHDCDVDMLHQLVKSYQAILSRHNAFSHCLVRFGAHCYRILLFCLYHLLSILSHFNHQPY